MFSLYRAWLSMSQPPDYQSPSSSAAAAAAPSLPLNLSAPNNANAPDVQLQVGPSLTNFSAHRSVLAAHSGFFKAALSNLPPVGALGPVPVPNIAVDEFSSLLTFMYTGYLDLNLGNIYNILLATHVLHMPRALELCRNFLMQQQQQQQQQAQPCPAPAALPSTSSIIKPIACRKPLPSIESLPGFSDAAEKIERRLLGNSTQSVFKIYHAEEDVAAKPSESGPSTSHGAPRPAKIATPEKAPKKEKKRRASSLVAQPARALSEERVIVDIACCDGPVRFHRVVNKNYGRKQPRAAAAAEGDEATSTKRTTLAAINKIMTENIKLASDATAANENQGGGGATGENPSATAPSDLYTCLYCNHTFKSQYCYQKHARRHLNPVDAAKAPDAAPADKQSASSSAGGKREFKLLDMNVQYYPCKTCGSKFPSYYFVHKHRKLCHADEMADGSNKNNEIVQVKPAKPKKAPAAAAGAAAAAAANVDDENSGAHEDTTGSDIIDVEETN